MSAPMTFAATPAATDPGCGAAVYRDFDFWLGHWQVLLADGRVAGENRIEAASDGCHLTERWRGARGSTGYSVNFYEPAGDRWRQLWVSADSIIEIGGGRVGGSMVLEGEIRYRQPLETGGAEPGGGGAVRPFRGIWTPLADGRVRQFFEEFRPDEKGQKRWHTWFEGFYVKVVE